jgi:Bifunctional DNA primase/polymerase, N-terminal
LAALEREHGALSATIECITPRGGRHVYFIVPNGRRMPGNTAGKIGAGIDTRGRNGYVVAPPSTVNGRPYAWSVDSGDRIAEVPGWLLDMLQRSSGNGHAMPPEEWQGSRSPASTKVNAIRPSRSSPAYSYGVCRIRF